MGYHFDEKGVPLVEADTCARCGACADVCPTETLGTENGTPHVAQRTFFGCIGCGHCMMVCPTGSITVTGRRLAPDQLVDLPPKDGRATADALDGLMLARRAVRRFTEEPVDRAAVDRILEMSATAPMGIPPSEVGILAFHGHEKVRRLAEDAMASFRRTIRMCHPAMLLLMRPFFGKAQHAMMRQFVGPLYRLITREWDEGRDRFTYDAPLALLFHDAPSGDPVDSAIAATYAMLAAESLSLASCMLGTTAALDFDKAFKAKYGIPQQSKIGLGLIIGHPKPKFQRGVRRKLGSVRFV